MHDRVGAGQAQYLKDKPLIQAEEFHLWMGKSWVQADWRVPLVRPGGESFLGF